MKSCDVITCSRKLSSLFIRRKEVVCCFLFNRHCSYYISLNEKNESNEKEVGGLAIRSIRVKQPHRKERKKSRSSSFYCSRFHPPHVKAQRARTIILFGHFIAIERSPPPYIIGLSCKVWLPNLFQVEELQWRQKKAFLSFRKWWCMTVYVCVLP